MVHPEADHAHGSHNHIHGGLYHSVLSSDLPCEYNNHGHEHAGNSSASTLGELKPAIPYSHSLNHDEIGFSLLFRSLELLLLEFSWFGSVWMDRIFEIIPVSSAAILPVDILPAFAVFVADFPTRAPPIRTV